MAILKKLVEFIRAKFGSFVARNTTVEDQYTEAANTLIDRITQLKTSHVLSVNEEKRIRALATGITLLATVKKLVVNSTLKLMVPSGNQAHVK